jgi:hypothetical protein
MDCERIRSLAAAGAELPSHLVRHVDDCAECRSRLEQLHALHARIDTALGEWLSIEPSPGFKAAVRRRAAEQAAPRWSAGWLLWPALAAGLAAIAWGVTTRTPSSPPAVADAPVAPPSAPAGSPDGAGVAVPTPEPDREPTVPIPDRNQPRRPSRAAGVGLREPEVLVPAADARALQAFYRQAVQGRPPGSLPANGDLAIAALEIEPLADSVDARPMPDGNGRGD